jgi:hypothetical protein
MKFTSLRAGHCEAGLPSAWRERPRGGKSAQDVGAREVLEYFAQLPACLDRDRGVRRDALPGMRAQQARPHSQADGATVCHPIPQGGQE